jgi:hypothetical protein
MGNPLCVFKPFVAVFNLCVALEPRATASEMDSDRIIAVLLGMPTLKVVVGHREFTNVLVL